MTGLEPESDVIDFSPLSKDQITAELVTTARQFDFARCWRSKIVPILDDPLVVEALTLGLRIDCPDYEKGDPPWEVGRDSLNGQRPRRGCLSWYQPIGRCHFIAPFCWAVGKRLYPDLAWGFISSDAHTVVIGHRGDWTKAEWVMDILLFKEMTAARSLAFAKTPEWRYYGCLATYLASFFTEPDRALEVLKAKYEILNGL